MAGSDPISSSEGIRSGAGIGATFERHAAPAILALEPFGPDAFVAGTGPKNHQGTVFGGHFLGQALRAATTTVEDMPVTSLHAYFLAAGTIGAPIEYRVRRLRDSRRFANRQVEAWQGDRLTFTLMCQFHAPEHGHRHRFAQMPDAPSPENVSPIQDFVRDNAGGLDPAILRNFSEIGRAHV